MLTKTGQLGSYVETVNTTGVYVLCGGASSRMGMCKTKVKIHGQPMVARILHTVSALHMPTFLVGKPSQQSYLGLYSTNWISDQTDAFHPLNGVLTALEHAKGLFTSALILPCDTPFISTECILQLLKISPSVAVDPSGRIHPLLLNIPISWIDRAQHHLEKQGSMKTFAETAKLVEIPYDSLRNFNNPSDLPTSTR